MAYLRRPRPAVDPRKEEALRLFRATLEEFGIVVINKPEFTDSSFQRLWDRDYSFLEDDDANVFRWLDEEVAAGKCMRAPYGHGLCYYTEKGTRFL